MACTDCFNGCNGNVISDKCVVYTGPDIDFLDIKTGDSISLLEAALIEKLESALNGTGITFEDLSLCENIEDALEGEDPTLANLIQAISDSFCSIQEQVDALDEEVNAPISIPADCLTLPEDPSRDDILVALAEKVCAIDTSVSEILSDYVKETELCEKVEDCLTETIVQESTKMPKYVAMPYHGSLSVFDSGGAGLESAGYANIYICNGQTVGTFVTPDYRGRSPIGANVSIPGGALDSAVDPSLPANVGYNIVNKTKKGNYTHTLTNTEAPAHTHSVNDPGHTHTYTETNANGYSGSPTSAIAGSGAASPTTYTYNTGSATTGVTIASSGGSQPHNTLHPVIGGIFIMYVPA